MFKKFTVAKQACDAFAQMDKELPWLQALDKVEGMELWGGINREDREPWKQYLKQADELIRKPRKRIPTDVVKAILEGDMVKVDVQNVPNAQPKVVVFVSSTFTDTKAERNQLMKDVYPFLRSLCRRLGVEFGTVDMRWGVTDEASSDHSTVQMCVNEIDRCIRDSVGPAFLCLLGHKYGYRPLPAQIVQTEYEAMQGYLEKNGKDTSLMKKYYALDMNAIPAEYVLKPREKEDSAWWDNSEAIQELLREASVACFGKDDEKCEKYHISVTETEIHNGAFNNPRAKDQTYFIQRDLKQYDSDTHLNRKITDLVQGKKDEYAEKMMKELRDKIPNSVPTSPSISVSYEKAMGKKIANDIINVCDSVCKNLAENVLESYENRLHVEADRVFQEAIQHRNHANEKANLFVGREEEIGRIMDYVRSSNKRPLVVHGQSGCGKTALMAVAARKVKDTIDHGIVVLRFLGTTGMSASARLLLHNVCVQLSRVYGKDVAKIPTAYKDLIGYFRECMALATSNKPLIMFLDSLDQLSNEDFGQNLAWLSLAEELPEHAKLIVSSLPIRTLDILKGNITDSGQFVEVKSLSLHEGPEIMKKMLEAMHRKVSDPQKEIILTAFKKCPLPLFLRLVVDIALKWHSYDQIDPDDLADDMPGLIARLFDRLESRYGEMFVHHALAYITAAKNGLSLAELEDVLSCDDDVLDNIFKWWTPPIRRIPPLLWARVRNELGMYLAERGTNGVSAYGWYHRQFWETAEKRYLMNPFGNDKTAFQKDAHCALADYFEGRWAVGKPYESKNEKMMHLETRKVPKQPLVVSGQRDAKRQLNERKLTELPYHLIKLQDWERFQRLVMDLEYIEAKFEAGDGYNCLSELIEATKLSGIDAIKQMTRFVGANLGFLVREPDAVYQMALQQARGNHIRNLVEAMGYTSCPLPLMSNMQEENIPDPCEMSLYGHTGSLRWCEYSPTGDLILSCADDSTMRLWDTTTGAELVTVTSLPEPIFPDKSESSGLMLHPVNPATFSRTGNAIAMGTELGSIILWDTSGVQLRSIETNNKAVTNIVYSPDNNQIAAVFVNKVLGVWAADTLNHVTTVNLNWTMPTCLDYSEDGTRLAVMCLYGLMLLDVRNGYKLMSQTQGQCYQNLCCSFLPNGGQALLSGGDDSCVSIWDGHKGTFCGKLRQHTAWIWSLKFTKDGQNMFTCSSDRSMKVWKIGRSPMEWSVVATVGGHSHRVSSMSIEANSQKKLVTSSLDRTLKVWDTKTLTSGVVPPVGQGHYHTCITTTSGKYCATAQGWFTHCSVFESTTGSAIGNTPAHKGFIRYARYSPDDTKLFVLDHGHCGQYTRGAEENAVVRVLNMPSLSVVGSVPIKGPTTFAVNNHTIIAGNLYGDVMAYNMDLAQICSWKHPEGEKHISLTAISKNNDLVAVGENENIHLLKLSGKKLSPLKKLTDHDTAVSALEFSYDGKYLVYGASSGTMYVYDTTKKNAPLFKVLKAHASYINDIKFSPSGYLMISAAALSMRVWRVKDGFILNSTFYAPVNCADFVTDDVVIVGEATGNKKLLKF